MEEDSAANKRTTVVLFGRRFASTWYLLNGFVAVCSVQHIWKVLPIWLAILLPMIYLVMHLNSYRALTQLRGKALNPLLGRTAMNLLVFTLLLIVAMAVGKLM